MLLQSTRDNFMAEGESPVPTRRIFRLWQLGFPFSSTDVSKLWNISQKLACCKILSGPHQGQWPLTYVFRSNPSALQAGFSGVVVSEALLVAGTLCILTTNHMLSPAFTEVWHLLHTDPLLHYIFYAPKYRIWPHTEV